MSDVSKLKLPNDFKLGHHHGHCGYLWFSGSCSTQEEVDGVIHCLNLLRVVLPDAAEPPNHPTSEEP